jgi:hypothetical protein
MVLAVADAQTLSVSAIAEAFAIAEPAVAVALVEA